MSDDAQPDSLWEPLGSRQSLLPTTLAVPAALGASGQAVALVIVDPRVVPLYSAVLAVAYWGACLVLLLAFSAVPVCWTAPRVGVAMAAVATLVGALLGVFLVESGWVTSVWPWVAAVIVGSAAVLLVGATIVRARHDYQNSFGQRERALASMKEQVEGIALAREAMAAISDDLIRSAATAAQEALVRVQVMDDAADIRAYIESAVRRPAREASHAVHHLTPRPRAVASRMQEWRSLPVHPHLVAAFAFVGALGVPFALLVAPPPAGVVGQVTGTTVGLACAAACLVLLRRWRFEAARALVALAIGVCLGMATSALIWWGDPGRAGLHALAFTPLALLIAATPAAMSVTESRRDRSLDALDTEVASAEVYVQAQRDALEADRREIAWVLHTRIQGRATAAQVALAQETGRETAMEILDELAAPTSRGTALRLDTVIQHWGRVMAVRVSGAELLTRADEPLAALTIDDALANSARHGGATRASVAINVEDGSLLIRITDDGALVDAPRSSGLGTRRVSARGGTWTIRSQPGGTEVQVALPIDRP